MSRCPFFSLLLREKRTAWMSDGVSEGVRELEISVCVFTTAISGKGEERGTNEAPPLEEPLGESRNLKLVLTNMYKTHSQEIKVRVQWIHFVRIESERESKMFWFQPIYLLLFCHPSFIIGFNFGSPHWIMKSSKFSLHADILELLTFVSLPVWMHHKLKTWIKLICSVQLGHSCLKKPCWDHLTSLCSFLCLCVFVGCLEPKDTSLLSFCYTQAFLHMHSDSLFEPCPHASKKSAGSCNGSYLNNCKDTGENNSVECVASPLTTQIFRLFSASCPVYAACCMSKLWTDLLHCQLTLKLNHPQTRDLFLPLSVSLSPMEPWETPCCSNMRWSAKYKKELMINKQFMFFVLYVALKVD